MEIVLPKKIDSVEDIKTEAKKMVVIGANGSGKTRFGTDIESRYISQTHRISAQKSLTMPKNVSPTSKESAEKDFLYGYATGNHSYKIGRRWGSNPNTHLLNDYQKLMVLLHTEEYEESIKFKEAYTPNQSNEKPVTKLDKIKIIWEHVLPHRRLIKKAGTIETCPIENPENNYNASEMSDGERIVFYLIGEVLSSPENAIIIIDEPEMHIHNSITKKLWDEIESERPDCTFIYLTHDIDFATSRQNSVRIWAKSFNGTEWDYEMLDSKSDLPEQVYLEILGSRKPILFIEGDNSSIDYKLLQLVFDEYTTKPLGSCQKVFEVTKSFNEQKGFHNIESFGLIDRDRRTDDEIAHINNPNIWVANVAEIENFLLLEKVIREVASNMMKNSNEVFEQVKNNIISFFDSQKETQALEHSLSRVERLFKNATDNSTVKTIQEFDNSLNTFWDSFDIKDIYQEILAEFQQLIDNANYDGILKVFNNKGIIANSQVVSLCDLNTKNDAYLNYIIGILKQNSDSAKQIKKAIIEKIENK
jgi:energy-coupling factor transporter ATP-binding protein EcfA2